MAQNSPVELVRNASTISILWGVLLIVFGIVAVGSPFLAAVAVNAVVAWLIAMAMLLTGGIVGGTGRILLDVLAIVLLVLAVAYVGLQVWYLTRAQRDSGPGGAHPGRERRPR